ncbi:metal ABC transporter solute-binding protein, Zn/Mn family [Arthrobacter sp. 35W]|uniref:metal ABC transporter solute-binding protein, Zn/Mn family n=1 Tax=Arthrobacter sp. 35W TaxID=1132441 RepID=UPI0009DD66F2|nr:zinc ABC transporter substrate-binding protein [Arthrobacter sp. 35W]
MNRTRSTLLASLALVVAGSLAACSGGAAGGASSSPAAEGTIEVVASTDVYGSIAAAIGGDKVNVHSIISKPGQDPHSYEATAQDKLAVSKADLGIENGGGYDDFFDKLAAGQLDAAKTVNVVELSGLEVGEGFNEHLWYNLPTMGALADDLATRFGALDGANAAAFTANATEFKSTLAGLETRLAALKTADGGASVAVTEPVPLYLLEAAGLSNAMPADFSQAIEEGTDVPAAVLKAATDLMGAGSVKFLAYNTQTEGPATILVKKAAEAAKVPVVDFSETLPAGQQYTGWMDANVAAIESALNG